LLLRAQCLDLEIRQTQKGTDQFQIDRRLPDRPRPARVSAPLSCKAYCPQSVSLWKRSEQWNRFNRKAIGSTHPTAFSAIRVAGGFLPLIGVPTIFAGVEVERFIVKRVGIVPPTEDRPTEVFACRQFD